MDTQTTYQFNDLQQSSGNGLYDLDLSEEKVSLMRRTIARGASEDELALFVEQCRRTGLDPFARQIYSVRRKQWNSISRSYEEAQVIQVSIDGFRLIADRTHKYAGQVGPWWCGPDGEWQEIWLGDEPPAAAKMGVLRHDFHQALYAVALFRSYVQTNSHGEPVSRWKTDPAGMLAKCAEALALRRAFPHELSGLYTTEEMGQADNPAATITPAGIDTQTQTPVQPQRTGIQRPFTPAELRANFNKAVATIETKGLLLGPDDFAITQDALVNLLEHQADVERYLEYVTGIPYLEDMNEAQVVALLRLLRPVLVDGTYIPCEEALSEAVTAIAWLETSQNKEDRD
jgi:phage recombination protein Bet